MILRLVCGALAVVLMFVALLFAGAGAVGAGSVDRSVVPAGPERSGRATGGSVPPPPVGKSARTSAALLPGVPLAGYALEFSKGACTRWMGKTRAVSWNADPGELASAVHAAGVPTSLVPSAGALVVYAAPTPTSGAVALVTDVGPGTFTASEVTYAGPDHPHVVPWSDPAVEGFLSCSTWFPEGECTSWAARNHPVSWTGNASRWLSAAAVAGVPISVAPSVGAIVVYAAAAPYDTQFGHVAVVTDVNLGTYTVSEMNSTGHGVVDARTIAWPDPHVEGFIP